MNPQNGQLAPVDLIAQLLEHCTITAEVWNFAGFSISSKINNYNEIVTLVS